MTYGAGTMAAASLSAEASRWISLAGAAAALNPLPLTVTLPRPLSMLPRSARRSRSSRSRLTRRPPPRLESYFNFGAYAIISSVIVSVGLVFSGMNEPERVRRMDAGPISGRQRSLAVFAAAAVLTVCIWFVSSMMGVVGFAGAGCRSRRGPCVPGAGGDVCAGVHAAGRWLYVVELDAREELLNGVGNLLGMLMTFWAAPGCRCRSWARPCRRWRTLCRRIG